MEKQLKNIFIEGAIDAQRIANAVENHKTKTDIGAHAIFLGQARADKLDDGVVTAIEYTAYEQMALEKAHEIREEMFEKYNLTCLHIYHSLGRVNAGEISLFVFASSKHRKPAIAACEEIVERIKGELPVWGREIINENKISWKVNK